jgi:hypothetical protein
MAVEKKIKYDMQGGVKNYLGKQKTASNVPLRWKSGPNAPDTELAYITKAEKDLLLKKDIHGSLKNGPNTGPEGIMSLDSQGDMGGSEDKGTNDDGSANSGKGDPDNNREQYGAVGQYSGPTSSPTSSDGPTNIHVDDPNAPPAYEIIGGKKYDVTPATIDIRERAKVKQAILNPTVKRNKIFDPISNSFINPFAPTVKTPLDRVKQILSIVSVLSPHTLVGKIGLGLNTYDKVKTGLQTVSSIADTFGINTDSITNSLSNNFSGKKSNTTTNTNTNNGGDGEGLASLENQASGYDEYILLLQKLQSGNITDSERNRYNVLKNMLGI